MAGKFQHLFNPGKTEADPPQTLDEDDIDAGPCAAVARGKWVTAVTVRHAAKSWESFTYSHLAARSVFEQTRFEVHFRDADERWRLVVTGRNLLNIYNLILQGRLEWIRAADRDFAGDAEQVILKIEAVQATQK